MKNDAWFNEKYNPELLDYFEKEKKELSKKNYTEFLERLEAGILDTIDLRAHDLVSVNLFRMRLEQFISKKRMSSSLITVVIALLTIKLSRLSSITISLSQNRHTLVSIRMLRLFSLKDYQNKCRSMM